MFKLGNLRSRRAEDKNKTMICTSTYINMNGCAPTLGELRTMTGVRSESAILRYIRELVNDGYFRNETKLFGLSSLVAGCACGTEKNIRKISA